MLHLYLRPEGPATNLPFELLYYSGFLIPSRVHLVRRISDRGSRRTPQEQNHPLRILFMASSLEDLSPVLGFEKEEETIYEVTNDLPVEIDVEDTGSLEGLAECLTHNEYDIVHLSGHADIDKDGVPFFWMEDEEGSSVKVRPSELSDRLNLNLPRLLFLSGCRTGESPSHAATLSFSHYLVASGCATVLGWGLPVSDSAATLAARQVYFDLARGKNIPDAVLSARRELFKHKKSDWPLLRLFSDGTPQSVPLVKAGQRRRPKLRDLQYTCLVNSHVKVLEKGFVGRRRQIQQGLRSLRKDKGKVGLLLHGTGGLGKSCLAGRFSERFKDHTLIVVHGIVNTVTFREALKDGFVRVKGRDKEGLRMLEEAIEFPDKLQALCSSSFQERPYLIVLDDFHENLTGIEEGRPEVSSEAVPVLEALLRYLPYSGTMSQLIITSRYTFPLTFQGENLIERRLTSIGLTSFGGADERKKVDQLHEIKNYPDLQTREQLTKAGRGNPRLMEILDTLLEEVKDLDLDTLLSEVKDKQEEFVQGLVLRQILGSQSEAFKTFLARAGVYRLPARKEGIKLVCERIKDWESHLDQAARLSLMEKDSSRKDLIFYWVTPLLQEEIFKELPERDKKTCHRHAASYYQGILSESADYMPTIGFEVVHHALNAHLYDLALEEEGERLLPYLRRSLAYKEALLHGEYVLSKIPKSRKDTKLARFLFELGWIHHDLGEPKKAIEYYEKALTIDRKVYGEKHPRVARCLNNLGGAWHSLADSKKAIEYFEKALAINRKVYGEKHPDVARCLNNLGGAWHSLGDSKKAIEYFEKALTIDRKVYGEKHPDVAIDLNNLGLAWDSLGDSKKAIEYFEKAYDIFLKSYGDRHPYTKASKQGLDSLRHMKK